MKVRNLAETENEVCFRQTFNQWSMNWQVPKKLKDGKWVPIAKKRIAPVITKQDGYRFALWRMRKVMLSRKDEIGRPMWKVNKMSTRYRVSKSNSVTYSIFQFDCHRIAHGIVGGMNTTGGN